MEYNSLKSKEVKAILKNLFSQYDVNYDNEELKKVISEKYDYLFFINNKNRIYIINKDYSLIDNNIMNVRHIGLYMGEYKNNSFRLSIEGAQYFYDNFKDKIETNILELKKEELYEWLKGNNIDLINSNYYDKDKNEYNGFKLDSFNSFIIILYDNDVYGSGNIKDNILLNYVSKIRRIKTVFE